MKKIKIYFSIFSLLSISGGFFIFFNKLPNVSQSFLPQLSNISSFSNLFTNTNEKQKEIALQNPSAEKIDLNNLETDSLNKTNVLLNKEKALEKMFTSGGAFNESSEIQRTKEKVESLYKEIKREEKVLEIQNDKDKQFKTVVEKNKIAQDSEKFQKSKTTIHDYLSSEFKTEKSGRKKRVAEQKENVSFLNKEERKSLQNYFQTYSELSDESKELLKRLENNTKDLTKSISFSNSINIPKKDEILKSLKMIEWDKDRIKLKGQLNKGNPPLYGWESWEKNPYRHFYSEEEYKKVMEELTRNDKDLEEYLKSKRVPGLFATLFGPGMVNWVYSDKDQYMKKIVESGLKIEAHIAQKLLSWMNQLNSQK